MIVVRLTILFVALMFSATSIAAVETHTIGVIGTGKMGSAIGTKLASAGNRIVYGSRDPSREEVRALVAKTGF